MYLFTKALLIAFVPLINILISDTPLTNGVTGCVFFSTENGQKQRWCGHSGWIHPLLSRGTLLFFLLKLHNPKDPSPINLFSLKTCWHVSVGRHRCKLLNEWWLNSVKTGTSLISFGSPVLCDMSAVWKACCNICTYFTYYLRKVSQILCLSSYSAGLTILAINYGLCYLLYQSVYLQRDHWPTFYRLLLPPSGQKTEWNGGCWLTLLTLSFLIFRLRCTGWKHHEVSTALWKCHLDNKKEGTVQQTKAPSERREWNKEEKEAGEMNMQEKRNSIAWDKTWIL